MFTKRNTSLAKEIKQLQIAKADLLWQQNEADEKEKITLQIIPTMQHIPNNYHLLSTEEKNQLRKSVMKKALSVQIFLNEAFAIRKQDHTRPTISLKFHKIYRLMPPDLL